MCVPVPSARGRESPPFCYAASLRRGRRPDERCFSTGTQDASLNHEYKGTAMEKEWKDRLDAIEQRLLELRDSL